MTHLASKRGSYITASVALTCALIGVILAPVFGWVAGVLIAFLVPFLDLGIARDPALRAILPAWAHSCPATAASGSFSALSSPTVSARPARC